MDRAVPGELLLPGAVRRLHRADRVQKRLDVDPALVEGNQHLAGDRVDLGPADAAQAVEGPAYSVRDAAVLWSVSAEPADLDLGVPAVLPDAAMGTARMQVGHGLGEPDGAVWCLLGGGPAASRHAGSRPRGAGGQLRGLAGGARGQVRAGGDDFANQAAG